MRVLELWAYPVKSLRGVRVEALTLDARGPTIDRRWMVVDPDGQFLTQRNVPAMARLSAQVFDGGVRLGSARGSLDVRPGTARRAVTVWRDTVEALDAGDEAAAWLGAELGVACRLVSFPDDVRRAVDERYAAGAETAFTDGYPLLIVNARSLDALNERLPSPVGLERFRATIVVRAGAPWVEDEWARLTIGGVRFDGVKPCARCAVITTDQATGARPDGSRPLDALAELHTIAGRGAIFGMNLVHRGLGTIRTGDEVVVNG